MRKFDLSLRSSRSSYFATFRHQLTILSKTDALDEEKWLNMLGTFVKDWRSEERRVGKECRSRWWPDHQKKEFTLGSGTWIGAHARICGTLVCLAHSKVNLSPE